MEQISHQLYGLCIFTIVGIIIGILFDLFRILRRSFKTPNFITYLEDILFWILTGTLLLFSIFQFNNGEIRGYIFVSLIIGVLLYMSLVSKFFIKYSVLIITFLKKIISYPIKLILGILKKLIFRPFSFIIINIRKNIKNIFKNTENKPKKKKLLNISFKKPNKKKDFNIKCRK